MSTTTVTPQQRMKAKLEGLGLPYKDIHVCGQIIGVYCVGRQTAERWHMLLSKFVKSSIHDYEFTNVENKNTVLLPSQHKGYRVGGIIR